MSAGRSGAADDGNWVNVHWSHDDRGLQDGYVIALQVVVGHTGLEFKISYYDGEEPQQSWVLLSKLERTIAACITCEDHLMGGKHAEGACLIRRLDSKLTLWLHSSPIAHRQELGTASYDYQEATSMGQLENCPCINRVVVIYFASEYQSHIKSDRPLSRLAL